MNRKPGLKSLLLLVVFLGATLCFLFHRSFVPGQALFSNDGPLGAILSRPIDMPGAFFGIWNDNFWIGAYNGNLAPNFSGLIHWVYQGVARVNFYCPTAVLILGVCAWIFFRSIGGNSRVSILAALAAALNMNFFSNAAWGLGTRSLSLGAAFLALAAIETGFVVQPVLTSILAGLALGMSVTEGGDNGAFFCVFIAAYAFWRTVISTPSRSKALAWGVGKVAVMAVCAGIMASQILGVFARTAVTGVVGTGQDNLTKEQKWDGNTMWSLPKLETLRVIIPGVFGYHMLPYAKSPEQSYWGSVGQNPAVVEIQKRANDPDPQVREQVANIVANQSRSSGAGEYAGVLVVLIGLWAIVEALRRKGQIFTDTERKIIWFWAGAALVAMLLGWGRHAPFYRLVYALPYFSTIRNPMKLFHVFDLCLMVLFAYGLIGLNRRYLEVPGKGLSILGQLQAWWAKGPAHEKLWTGGCIAAVALSAVGWFGYLGSKSSVVKHLMEWGFNDQQLAASIASFSIREVLLFVITLAVCVLVVTLIISGAFAGARANWAAFLLGTILVVDLSRANMPWIRYDNWKEQYASNGVFDVLRDKPHEHRVTVGAEQLQSLYQGEWIQRQFPYYGIQSIDIPQEPRLPADKQAYRTALAKNIGRLWQLTNTRYVLGMAGGPFTDMLNRDVDPVGKSFRQHTAFTIFRKPGSPYIVTETNTTGPVALIEFGGALPRAKLYSDWEVITEEKALLARLGDPAWNPAQSVLLSQDAPKPTATNAAPGTAVILRNPTTKLMEIETTSTTPALLLLNDKIEPEWHAYIDGQAAAVLRANYLMRGVHVPAGKHNVVFKYEMKASGFYLVLGCDLAGLAILGFVVWSAKRKQVASSKPGTRNS